MLLPDPDNPVILLCVEGMEAEGMNHPEMALALFTKAWDTANTPLEKLIAAHYLARQQTSIAEKLHWDTTALQCALQLPIETAAPFLPSLYLNLAHDHESLEEGKIAYQQYQLAQHYSPHLQEDGYGQLIRGGIRKGLERTSQWQEQSK